MWFAFGALVVALVLARWLVHASRQQSDHVSEAWFKAMIRERRL